MEEGEAVVLLWHPLRSGLQHWIPKQHLLPSSEAWPAGAVGSPALSDAPATIQAGEVLATLLRGKWPPGESKGQPLEHSGFGEGQSVLGLRGNGAGKGHKHSPWYF